MPETLKVERFVIVLEECLETGHCVHLDLKVVVIVLKLVVGSLTVG